MRLGLVTYNLAKDWDIPTIIKNAEATGFEAVELRTTHKHGVEPSLTAAEREDVKRQFLRSKVRLLSLGSVCEYHAADRAEVERNIEETRKFVVLAHDIGAWGVKVRPNGFPASVPREQTLRQIGEALRTCGEFGMKYGVEIWVEVHGAGTQEPPNMRKIMEHANHSNVFVCWNSNPTDVVNGSVKESFGLLSKWIRNVHITELHSGYPYRELFALLKGMNYDRYTLAEIPASCEAERLMRYYRELWRSLVG
jgi:sugar phosphate isomerase/epimerase